MTLSVTELRKGAIFAEDGTPFLVLEYTHTKVGRGNANIKVKVRNLRTGAVMAKSFVSGASVEEAEVNRRGAQYLYSDSENAFFMDPKSFDQFSLLRQGFAGQAIPFMKEGAEVALVYFRGEPLSVEIPLKVNLKVAETGPSEKGDTRSSATKEAVLETGYKLQVPMFIKTGDTIRVNTETGKYVERA
jgi:elongation factor P